MTIYIFLLFIASINVFLKNRAIYIANCFFIACIIGFRYRIGTDWWVYDKLIYRANNDYKILGIIEPGSFFLLKLSALFDSRGYEFLVVMQGLLTFYVFF